MVEKKKPNPVGRPPKNKTKDKPKKRNLTGMSRYAKVKK